MRDVGVRRRVEKASPDPGDGAAYRIRAAGFGHPFAVQTQIFVHLHAYDNLVNRRPVGSLPQEAARRAAG